MENLTDSDRIKFLYRQNAHLNEAVNTLRGRNAALESRLVRAEKGLSELNNLRDLDRAKVSVLASQLLEVTTSQIEIATGGLQNRVPEPGEALSALTIHAGRKAASALGQKIAAAIALLALGGLASLPLLDGLVQPLPTAEVQSLDSDG
jgi:hypothetical protein